MNKEYYKLRNYNEEGLRLRNKKKYLLQRQYLLELQKQKQEALLELQENKRENRKEIIMRIIMETERVYFVAVDEEYVDFYIENMNNPEIYRHLADNPRTYTREEEIEWIRENVEANQFTIIDKNTGELIGNAGYHEIIGDTGEIGIWITPAHQNNHYGREIIMKLVEYGYDVLKVRHVTLKVHDNNERAKHVYEKVGFQRTGTEEIITDGIGNPTKNITMEYIKERR